MQRTSCNKHYVEEFTCTGTYSLYVYLEICYSFEEYDGIIKILLLQALYQVGVLLILNYTGKSILRLNTKERANEVKNTVIFNAFVLCQVSIIFEN